MILNDDLYYQILLNSNINDIQHFYKINKHYYQFLCSYGFWMDKFNHDGLPLLIYQQLKTPDDWIKEYKYIQYCQNNAYNIFKIHNIIYENIIYLYCDESEYNLLFSLLPLFEEKNHHLFNINNDISIKLYIIKNNQHYYYIKLTNIDTMMNQTFKINGNVIVLLTKLIYYISSLYLEDSLYLPLLEKDILYYIHPNALKHKPGPTQKLKLKRILEEYQST
jgi:hypothetical protein